jgi:hypothetical protein
MKTFSGNTSFFLETQFIRIFFFLVNVFLNIPSDLKSGYNSEDFDTLSEFFREKKIFS